MNLYSTPRNSILTDFPEGILKFSALVSTKIPVEKSMIQGSDIDFCGNSFGMKHLLRKTRHTFNHVPSSFPSGNCKSYNFL